MSIRGDCVEGREHFMFSALVNHVKNEPQVVCTDWCTLCGRWDDNSKPHMTIKGKRREVDVIEPPEGLL